MPLIPRIDVNKQFTKLGWNILYHKCLYYELAGIKKFDYLRISDEAFDKLTKQYLNLAKLLKIEPSAHNLVGFNPRSPSGSLVLAKILMEEHFNKKRKTNVNTK
jgi:hypothetical protein